MPEFLNVEGIVIKAEPVGEQFRQLYLLTGDNGLVRARQRLSVARPGRSSHQLVVADWLDDVAVTMRRSGRSPVWYVTELDILRRPTALSRSLSALNCVGRFSHILFRNVPHLDFDEHILCLLKDALVAWESQPHPDVTLLKAIFSFARNEGLPVKESWAAGFGGTERSLLRRLLNKPLVTIDDTDAAGVPLFLNSLEAWLRSEADWIMD